ncbi:ABC transporter substrate-binding protein [Maribacter antarcticus]|uniref:ABC transporter substrate-binding protein n=1 Tax=Maribacter antarcticus TaxID=505250 RepID=UPI0009FC8B84|nr:ABC transporter substrate-binding protein [Maribacter antarcticus]
MIKKIVLVVILCAALLSCGSENKKDNQALKTEDWETISKSTNGKTVNFMMWQGSPVINEYINNYIIPTVKEEYGVNLQISGGQGPEIVQLAMSERQAGITESQVDIVWINGETFFQLRSIDALWGPFLSKLPNSQYINFDDPFVSTDFQQPIKGMEAPWSMGQFAMVYDATKADDPPATLDELEAYIKKHPGTFTISNDFTGMTLMKSFLAELGGSPTSLNGEFDEDKYVKLSGQLWDWVNGNKQYFWKEGTTFPKEQSIMSQLFANGEVNITYGFSEGGVEERVTSGLYPNTTKAYPWKNGTIKNANYLGILSNATEKAAAMQVINFMISPEAQFEKARANGMDSNTILDVKKLPQQWQDKFKNAPGRQYGIKLEELSEYAIAEPAPEYMIRLYEDFRTKVIEK